MKNQTYQLSAQGIERLEKFKRDVLAGDFDVEPVIFKDDRVLYHKVLTQGSMTCSFIGSASGIAGDVVRQIDNTLQLGASKNEDYFIGNGSGVPLNRTDITTPAQRALESLAKRLNQGSYANA